ncbi:MAG: 4-hydroxy-tetrahydrodipicolinate reductase [Paludibacteraceae bacterium]|nr:4-hydroxy-tetrahydrodipicolinate reductase [Paludibacteraceae bacterium]
MKIALIGYGKMGHIIEEQAKKRGHEIVATIDINNYDDIKGEAFKSADVAIEFSRPESAVGNILNCFAAGVPVVCGTTGWTKDMDKVQEEMKKADGALLWSSNFSVGVNIFFALNKYLASIMNRFNMYDVDMTEIHHIHKLDAPSGTAITLAEGILENLDRKSAWKLDKAEGAEDVAIKAVREGEVPGTHIIHYDSDVDSITIKHEAKSRAGFALGAVIAAEFLAGKKGFYDMKSIFDF